MEEEYFDIYDTPTMRAALGLYTGHRAPGEAAPLSEYDEDETDALARRIKRGRKSKHSEEDNKP